MFEDTLDKFLIASKSVYDIDIKRDIGFFMHIIEPKFKELLKLYKLNEVQIYTKLFKRTKVVLERSYHLMIAIDFKTEG